MNNDQQRIWDYLIINALGKANAKHIEVIANELGFPPHGTNNDDVRGLIKDMVMNHGRQIGTHTTGAFVILNDQEREEAARYVERRNRARSVRENGNYIP